MPKFNGITADPSDTGDTLFVADAESRYLGHAKAKYGFVLRTPLADEEYVFDYPPQNIEQDEDPSTVIRATQSGGKFIEAQGSIFKIINISGTTGFAPPNGLSRTAGALGASAASSLLPTATRDALLAQNSGYAAFHRLRRIFRWYAEIQRNGSPEDLEKLQLYWINTKDNESWLVEPLSFRMTRSANSSRLTYVYQIRLQTLARGTAPLVPEDPVSTVTTFSKVTSSLRDVRDRITTAVNVLNGAVGTAFSAFRTIQSEILSIVSIGSTVASGLDAVSAGLAEVVSFPRALIAEGSNAVEQVFESMANLVVNVPVEVNEALLGIKMDFAAIRARSDLFQQSWLAKWASLSENYNRTFGTGGDASEYLDAPFDQRQDALRQETVQPNESLEQFTRRTCGDTSKVHAIAVLNNLEWPYFSPSADERAPSTAAPGDRLLIPVSGTSKPNNSGVLFVPPEARVTYSDEIGSATSSSITKAAADQWRTNQWSGYALEILSGAAKGAVLLVLSNTATTVTLDGTFSVTPSATDRFKLFFRTFRKAPSSTGLDEAFGTDIALVKTADGLFDIAVSNGDCALVKGVSNVAQALEVKFAAERGAFPMHPWLGLRPAIGSRAVDAAFRYRIAAEEVVLSDGRVDALLALNLTIQQGVVSLDASIRLRGGANTNFNTQI